MTFTCKPRRKERATAKTPSRKPIVHRRFVRRLVRALLFAAASLSWIAATPAQTPAFTPAPSLTLTELLERARAGEPTYLAARAAVDGARARKDQAFGAMLPQLTASAGTHSNRRDYETRNDFTPRENDAYNNHSAQLSLTQPLWRPANDAGLEQAKKMVTQAEWQLSAAEQELAARLTEAWFELLAARDAKVFADRQREALQQEWRITARAQELGVGSEPRSAAALARLEQAKADTAVAEMEIEQKRAALEQWVGPLPRLSERSLPYLRAQANPANSASPAKPPADLDAWLREVEEGNPSLLAAREALEAARAEVKKQRAGHSPTLDIVASYGRNSQAVGGFPGQAGYDITQGSIGLQLNVPLYSGGTQSAKVAEALAQEERARQEVEAARRTAVLAAQRAWFAGQGATARAAAGAQAMRAARAELARAQKGRDQGLQTRLEILQAEQQLRAGARDHRKGRYDRILMEIRLKVAAGALAMSDISGLDALFAAHADPADPEAPAATR
ncbi:MAG: TolC family protein [Azoarcus sp.]|jgi:outer membrane protein|nr:TolC family protein [Azoarcus sp.]